MQNYIKNIEKTKKEIEEQIKNLLQLIDETYRRQTYEFERGF